MSKEIEKKIGQLQYEISLLGLDREELTGVTIRTDELKDLVKNIAVTHCCESDSELLAEHKCKFYVNADWSYLKCDCGKRIKPSEG